MKIDLTDTNSSKINAALTRARLTLGTAWGGRALTLVVATDEPGAYDALKAASEAARDFLARVVVVVRRDSGGTRRTWSDRVDAELEVGHRNYGTGESVVVRLYGQLVPQAQSVVLPLLLPDAPVAIWWPENAPANPSKDPLGALAQRRITDALSADDPLRELAARAASYAPGDTDLAWTRITPWRSMLAVALDEAPDAVSSFELEAAPEDPSAQMLERWLAHRLNAPVLRTDSGGPAITAVRLHGPRGLTALVRESGRAARLLPAGGPERHVALADRTVAELLREELQHLDHDPLYGATVGSLAEAFLA